MITVEEDLAFQSSLCLLTNIETCYITIKLELLAVAWVLLKSKFSFVSLQHFNFFIDCSPMLTTLNRKSLDAI